MSRYRIRYSYETAPCAIMTRDLGATSPIAALNQFHTTMQIDDGVDAKAYSVKGVSMIYAANAFQRTGDEMVESEFDLPKCGNPILKKKLDAPGLKQEVWF